MSRFIDPEDVKKIVAEQTAVSKPHRDDGGYRGAMARAIRDLYEPTTLWRVGEINRHTDTNDIISVVMRLATVTIAAQLATDVHAECYQDLIPIIGLEFAAKLQGALKEAMSDRTVRVDSVEMGSA